jgi:hypothetical protein
MTMVNINCIGEEFIERYTYVHTLQEYFEGRESIDIPRPYELVGERQVYQVTEDWEHPGRLSLRFLKDLDLGPELHSDNGVGQINFYNRLSPANDSQFIDVPD